MARCCAALAALLCVTSGTATVAAAPADSLDRFEHQNVVWHECPDEDLVQEHAQCAEITVPLDYSRPDGATLAIATSRIAARDHAHPLGLLLTNPGGPGVPGLDASDLIGSVIAPDVLARYDLIGFDPRGVGRSNPLPRCGWPVADPIRSAGADLPSFVRETGLQAQLAASCLSHDPATGLQMSTRNTARDMDVIRAALGQPRMSYFGVSYGTYLGAVYTQMFPDHCDRIVLDSAIDPQKYWLGLQQDWGPKSEVGLDQWTRWAAARDATYHLGATGEQVRDTIQDLIAHAAQTPIVVEGYPIDDHFLPELIRDMLSSFRLNEELAQSVQAIAEAAAGRPPHVEEYLHHQLELARTEEQSSMVRIWCDDAAMPHDPGWYWNAIEAARPTQPVFGALANNIQPCAFWPPPAEPQTVVDNTVPSLVLAATDDIVTPYQHSQAMHHALAGSHLVTLAGVRIHMTLRPGLSACILRTTSAYYRDGILPEGDTTCYPDRTVANPA